MRAGLIVMALLATGCGASLKDAADAMNAANVIATEAQPCLVEMRQREVSGCGNDAACLATVQAHWGPVADAYDAFHGAWCVLVPDAAGCP